MEAAGREECIHSEACQWAEGWKIGGTTKKDGRGRATTRRLAYLSACIVGVAFGKSLWPCTIGIQSAALLC